VELILPDNAPWDQTWVEPLADWTSKIGVAGVSPASQWQPSWDVMWRGSVTLPLLVSIRPDLVLVPGGGCVECTYVCAVVGGVCVCVWSRGGRRLGGIFYLEINLVLSVINTTPSSDQI